MRIFLHTLSNNCERSTLQTGLEEVAGRWFTVNGTCQQHATTRQTKLSLLQRGSEVKEEKKRHVNPDPAFQDITKG